MVKFFVRVLVCDQLRKSGERCFEHQGIAYARSGELDRNRSSKALSVEYEWSVLFHQRQCFGVQDEQVFVGLSGRTAGAAISQSGQAIATIKKIAKTFDSVLKASCVAGEVNQGWLSLGGRGSPGRLVLRCLRS